MIERYFDPPFQPVLPVCEPLQSPIPLELAFPPKMREWWFRVGDGKCQTHIYDEVRGWYICGSTNDIEIDHIDPESVQLVEGHDPNNSVGIPRCKYHHTGRGVVVENGELRLAHYGEPNWSRHPDMGKALLDYRNGDKDAFKKAAYKHTERAIKGQRITNSSPEVDQFETDYMLSLEKKYVGKSGLHRPQVKPNPRMKKRLM